MRLNRFISSTGLCSRRKADELIKEGKVKVNNNIATIGLRVDPEDRVEVNGKLLEQIKTDVYITLYMPLSGTSNTPWFI